MVHFWNGAHFLPQARRGAPTSHLYGAFPYQDI